jgi:HEAT repeat protein
MLHDRQNPGGQNQAALLLVNSQAREAEVVLRHTLRHVEDVEVFQAVASAVRLCQDRRFNVELVGALTSGRAPIRQAAAEALAVLANASLVEQLGEIVADCKGDLGGRQAALWVLARCGRKDAAGILIECLASEEEAIRLAAAEGLASLSGHNYGMDLGHWNSWWEGCKNWTNEQWLERRLAYQASRSRRLEGDLARARSQVLRLEQQLYSRLPMAERVGHIRSLVDQDDAAIRLLGANWSVELLPGADSTRLKELMAMLLRLSRDSCAEVQRAAVLGLGKFADEAVIEQLLGLLEHGRPAVRPAAARSLAALARGPDAAAMNRKKRILPALQMALGDPSHEVVVEAAEELGALGALEAGPVLTSLLRHSSENVRQAATQALERVADASVLEGLLGALSDPSAAVRFGLVGALSRAARDGQDLTPEQHQRVLKKLEELLQHDLDAGVRSRAATALGELAPPTLLRTLWECVVSGEDGRVQEKAWAAFIEVLARSAYLPLLREWDKNLTARRQGPRRLQMLAEVAGRWQRRVDCKVAALSAQEMLIEAYLELGKWGSAAPVVRDLLARQDDETEIERRMRWMLAVGEQALHEGNHGEALRAVKAARPYLPRTGPLAESFDKLEKAAQKE